ncbi:EamA family transporter [Apibacter adventoris]|uniref:Transporter n=1 Tax=Apibacter adventoris TaxID=1679466 RepID=A0A2S8A835_9FLAO|nr:EamA family transporter [Apibacter adventoris]PQL90734.1 transporter [Apibacter adventoris]
MKEVFISIIFNVGVSILLKISGNKRYNNNLMQIITYNYLFSAIFCYCLYPVNIKNLDYSNAPWFIFISLSFLMPFLFIIIGKCIKSIGIAKTDIAQRMSLLITILSAFLFFKESYTLIKLLGLSIGFFSIFFIFHTSQKNNKQSNQWFLPLIIFLGLGLVNILYKLISSNLNFTFTTSSLFIFSGSFIFSLIFNIIEKQKFQIINIFWGLGLSILNFGNVIFYLKAHVALKNNPSIVFATMNLGVIILGSLIGIVFFKEKMSKLNYFGLALALLSILTITLL